MFNQRLLALDTSVGDLADLFAVVFVPTLVVEFFIKFYSGERVDEVDKRVAEVAAVSKVDWEIEEIKASPADDNICEK